jgi:hypothetical protein
MISREHDQSRPNRFDHSKLLLSDGSPLVFNFTGAP